MPEINNTTLLEQILQEQKQLARQQLQLGADLSSFMNKQSAFNQRISGLIDSDPATNSKGLVESLTNVKERVLDLEVKNKITAGKVAISVIIVSAIGTIVWKLISILD